MRHPCFRPHRVIRRWVLVAPAVLMILFGSISSAGADERGEELYRQGRFAEAEQQFLKQDMDNPLDVRFRYNRGCAAYGNEDYKAASAAFQSVLTRSEDPDMKRRSIYNLGNTAFQEGRFDKAAAAFKKALILDPNDADARHNLELALRSMREAEKQQEQQKGSEQQDSEDKSDASKSEDNSKGENSEENKQNSDQNQDAESKQNREDKENQSDKETRNENQPSQKEKPEKQDEPSPREQTDGTSGDAAPNAEEQKQEETATVPMDAKMAEALLDNVEENRKPYYLFQARGAAPRSGKDW